MTKIFSFVDFGDKDIQIGHYAPTLLPQQSKIKGQKTLKTHPTIIFELREFIS
jgi:hypothetical protein